MNASTLDFLTTLPDLAKSFLDTSSASQSDLAASLSKLHIDPSLLLQPNSSAQAKEILSRLSSAGLSDKLAAALPEKITAVLPERLSAVLLTQPSDRGSEVALQATSAGLSEKLSTSVAQLYSALPTASEVASLPIVGDLSQQLQDVKIPKSSVELLELTQASFMNSLRKMFREPPRKHATPKDYPASYFVKGLLAGLKEPGNTRQLLRCVRNARYLVGRVALAVENFKKMDLPGMGQGAIILFDVVREILDTIDPRMKGFEQLKKVGEAVVRTDYKELAMRAILDSDTLVKMVEDCVEGFEKKEYQRAGKAVGDLFYRLFLMDVDEIWDA